MAASPAEIFLVVIAGGSGTRFWPKSTSKRPKQLIAFDDEGTLLGKTFARFGGILPEKNRMVVTTDALAQAVRADIPGVEVLAEPEGRNTAPCVYWAARAVAAKNPEAVMLVMPADHHIGDPERFRQTVKLAAARAASKDELVTLGVKPSRPETGYGYLRVGSDSGDGCRKVDAFVEKPDLEKAKRFLAEGNYLWNGGMFLWRASTILAAFDRYMPEMKKAWDAAGGDAIRAYPDLTATSIDFGVMEKASNVVTFSLDCGWDDLGSWTSLEDLGERTGRKTADGTVIGGELLAVDGGGHVIDAPGKLVATLGVEDLIIVESGGAILVARKD
ncbi:MAG TPA: sugar phosphate nucleotidyltransferase, partial [Bdellovibrionota bacterium]|nr:sugar phosphate nucleotidyltransferase [Bdellovibrionota bacterium]